MIESAQLPDFARLDRTLPEGEHLFIHLLPLAEQSPAMSRVFLSEEQRRRVLPAARLHLRDEKGFAWIDEEVPCIILTSSYYRGGSELDLYLDLLHELTHLRQLDQGRDVWDERFEYVDRETEIEGYAVAVEEGLRLGMSEAEVLHHLSNPWMSQADVQRLRGHIDRFLGR